MYIVHSWMLALMVVSNDTHLILKNCVFYQLTKTRNLWPYSKIACFINLLKDCVGQAIFCNSSKKNRATSELRVLSIIKHAILSDRKNHNKLRVLSIYLRIASIASIALIASIACFITSLLGLRTKFHIYFDRKKALVWQEHLAVLFNNVENLKLC